MKRKLILIPVFLIPLLFSAAAQDDSVPCGTGSIKNKKAESAYEQGVNRKNSKEERLDYLKKALDLEPDFIQANFAYAEERIKTLSIENAAYKPTEPYFKKVADLCPKYHSDPFFYLGWIYYEQEKWDDCVKYLKLFLNFKDDDDKKFNKNYDDFLEKAKKMMYWAKFYNEIYKNRVPFDPHPVKGINTPDDEYLATISPDDQTMYFTRKLPHVNKFEVAQASDREDEFFCFSKRSTTTGEFDKGRRMQYPFNQKTNEGGATVSIDNKHLFFTICKNEGGEQLNCDVYFSDYIEGEWTVPAKVPGINDPVFWDSQPTLASDGKTLYFCSDRGGGYGGVDVYITVRDSLGVWSKPKNMGKPINTGGDEFTPFLHSDFQSLYFSSDGHPGVGGKDIFFSHLGDDGKWSEPKNLGIPINTSADDIGFFVSTDGHLGYFASNQPSRVNGQSVGKYDIYSFPLYKEVRPDEIVFIKGKVEDNSTGDNKKFTVEIKDAVTKKTTAAMVDTLSGEYTAVVNVKEKHDLMITVKKENAAFSSQLIAKETVTQVSTKRDEAVPDPVPPVGAAVASKPEKTTTTVKTKPKPAVTTAASATVSPGAKRNTVLKPLKTEMKLDTLKVGDAYTLNNIYYTTNSAELDPRSSIVIEEFADYLKANPTIKIDIYGHTDNVGKDKDNLALSTDRAFTVRDLLIKKGVAEARIIAFKGFGATKPVADNVTEEGRSKNRRTEFMIVSK